LKKRKHPKLGNIYNIENIEKVENIKKTWNSIHLPQSKSVTNENEIKKASVR